MAEFREFHHHLKSRVYGMTDVTVFYWFKRGNPETTANYKKAKKLLQFNSLEEEYGEENLYFHLQKQTDGVHSHTIEKSPQHQIENVDFGLLQTAETMPMSCGQSLKKCIPGLRFIMG